MYMPSLSLPYTSRRACIMLNYHKGNKIASITEGKRIEVGADTYADRKLKTGKIRKDTEYKGGRV